MSHCDCVKNCIEDELAKHKLSAWVSWPTLVGNPKRVPDAMGLFLWRWKAPVPRFDGACRLLYVGRGAMQDRMRSHLDFKDWPDWKRESWSPRTGDIEVAWIETMEFAAVKERLLDLYGRAHGEFPPGNLIVEEKPAAKKTPAP